MDTAVVPIKESAERSRDYLKRFVDALFRYADEDSWVALRVFRDDGVEGPAILSDSYRLNDPEISARVERAAVFAAEQPFPAVFCPPIASFAKGGTAKHQDMANGLALSVECDNAPEVARKRLTGILGEPTIVVESGGVWADPESEWPEYKVHLHWRLTEPTRSPQDHAKLQLARSIACDIVGADGTSKNPVHPMRWPGSWHRKRQPRMASIVASNDTAELELDDALERLREAHIHVFKDRPVPTMDRKRLGGSLIQGLGLSNPLKAQHLSDVSAALEAISNVDLPWDRWNYILMAAWSATDGSPEGLEMAQEWSAKSNKHNQAATAARWQHYRVSPPERIGAGTLFHLAKMEEPEWTKPSAAEMATATNVNAPPPGFTATPFVWTDPTKIPPRRWLYGKHYIRQFLSATIAPGGVGKSSLTIAEAIAIVTGRPILQERVWEPSKVWLWNGEDPIEELQRRIAATCLHHNIPGRDIEGRLFLDSGRNQEIIIAHETRDGVIVAQPMVDALIKTIRDNDLSVLIIDPFVSSHRVTENDNNAIDRVAKEWSKIADITHCSIELVHHARKTGGGEVTAEHGRGAIALISAARSVRVLNRMTPDEGEKARVQIPALHFRVDDGKANLAPPADKSQWFRLASVELGNGGIAGGDKVGAVTPFEWPDPMEGVGPDTLKAVQRTIGAGEWRHDTRSKDWAGHAIAQHMRVDMNDPADRQAVKSILDMWVKNGALVKEDGEDEHRHKKTFIRVGRWAE